MNIKKTKLYRKFIRSNTVDSTIFDSIIKLMEKYGGWDNITTYQWIKVLQKYPKYWEHCPIDSFNDNDWFTLVKYLPQYENYYKAWKLMNR